MEELPIGIVIASLGFIFGIIFGATAQRTNFCTMGALSDIIFMGNWVRFRAWMLTIAVAVFFSQLMHLYDVVDLNNTIYLTPNFGWAGAIIGGLVFGFGMTMTGGCGSKILIRLGAGNLKSLVGFIFLGIFAYMTLRGLFGPARIELEQLTVIDLKEIGISSQGIPSLLGIFFDIDEQILRSTVTGIIVSLLVVFCFIDKHFRNSPKDITAGIIIGILVPAAWYLTGFIGKDDFDPTPLTSFTFVSPIGETIQYLMTFTGSTANFGIATVGGVVLGSFFMSKVRGEFRIESFMTADDFVRHVIGSALMGIGGVIALGCTIGQGITGISTLALGSIITICAIILGGIFGLRYLEQESFKEAVKAMISNK
jgi:uncharacterized membrane protein YedE/YeeE